MKLSCQLMINIASSDTYTIPHVQAFSLITPYSRKIWRGIKFGGLAVCFSTAKFLFLHAVRIAMRTIPPNLNPPIV